MNHFPGLIQALHCFLRETFRLALASRLFLLLILFSGSILFMAATVRFSNIPSLSETKTAERIPLDEAVRLGQFEIQQDGTPIIQGEIRLFFGTIRIPWNKYRENAVLFLESLLAFFLADWAGLILALVFTAAIVPDFLRSGWWDLLRLHQRSTWVIILIKLISILILYLSFTSLTLLLCWLTLNLATNSWHPAFLWAIPILAIQFSSFYPISVFLAVWTKNTSATLFGTMAFWGICWLVNHGRMTLALADPAFPGSLLNAGYWLLPKPVDFSMILSDLIGILAENPPPHAWHAAWIGGWIHPGLSIFSSLLFALMTTAGACYELANAED